MEFLSKIKSTWQQINTECKKDYQENQLNKIQESTTKRASYIVNNQKKMLNSLLNRFKESITVDKLLVEQNGSYFLITEPDEILKAAPSQYGDLQRERDHRFNNISDD